MSARRIVMGRWRAIIAAGLAALLLAGCSMLRIGYSQAPTLTYWWFDRYVDLDGAQAARLREGLDDWFDWHRRTELPRYVDLLARAQREVLQPTITPASMCAWRDEMQRRIDASVERALPLLSGLVLSLSTEQLRHIERKLTKNGEEMATEFAQTDRDQRAQASFQRSLERFENLYGRLEAPQRERLGRLLAASTFDAERWLAERERRNRDLVATLSGVASAARTLGDASLMRPQAEAAVRLIAERALRSPRADYRAYAERLTQDNCALAAAMHNGMSAAQRQRARDKFKSWEDDLRFIVAQGAAASPNAAAAQSR